MPNLLSFLLTGRNSRGRNPRAPLAEIPEVPPLIIETTHAVISYILHHLSMGEIYSFNHFCYKHVSTGLIYLARSLSDQHVSQRMRQYEEILFQRALGGILTGTFWVIKYYI